MCKGAEAVAYDWLLCETSISSTRHTLDNVAVRNMSMVSFCFVLFSWWSPCSVSAIASLRLAHFAKDEFSLFVDKCFRLVILKIFSQLERHFECVCSWCLASMLRCQVVFHFVCHLFGVHYAVLNLYFKQFWIDQCAAPAEFGQFGCRQQRLLSNKHTNSIEATKIDFHMNKKRAFVKHHPSDWPWIRINKLLTKC